MKFWLLTIWISKKTVNIHQNWQIYSGVGKYSLVVDSRIYFVLFDIDLFLQQSTSLLLYQTFLQLFNYLYQWYKTQMYKNHFHIHRMIDTGIEYIGKHMHIESK